MQHLYFYILYFANCEEKCMKHAHKTIILYGYVFLNSTIILEIPQKWTFENI